MNYTCIFCSHVFPITANISTHTNQEFPLFYCQLCSAKLQYTPQGILHIQLRTIINNVNYELLISSADNSIRLYRIDKSDNYSRLLIIDKLYWIFPDNLQEQTSKLLKLLPFL